MKNRHLVVWGWGLGAISAVIACAPEVTVSKDDDSMGGEGATDVVTTVGGSASVAGSGGSAPAQGGSSGTGAVAGGRGGTGGDDSFVSAGAPGVPENCPCTRRPGGELGPYCRPGAPSTNDATIGPDGGDIELSGTASTEGVPVRLRIPAGTLNEDTTITLSETTLLPPDEVFDVSPVYRVDSDGMNLIGAELSIPWLVPSGPVPQELHIYWAPEPSGRWSALDSYTNAGFEQANMPIGGSGYFVVGYPRTDDLAACP